MKTIYCSITKSGTALSVFRNSKGMGCIVDRLKSISGRNLLNHIHVTKMPINMNWHDCTGTVCNQIFNLRWVKRKIIGFYVAKTGFKPLRTNA